MQATDTLILPRDRFVAGAQSLTDRWRDDWSLYGQQALGIRRFTDQQRQAAADILANAKWNGGTGKNLIKSGHGTGKTWFAAFLAHAFLELHEGSQVICMSSSGPQVKERLWAEFRKMHRRATTPIGGELGSMSLRFDDDWKALAVSPANPDNFQGGHANYFLIVFDEAQGIPAEFWEASEGMLGSERAMFVGIFNPLYASGSAFESWHKPDEFIGHTFSCIQHPNVQTGRNIIPGAVTRQWVLKRRRLWGKDSNLYRTRVLGRFPKGAIDTLVSMEELERVDVLLKPLDGEGTWMGLDIARQGDDSCECAIQRHGRIVVLEGWQHNTTMETVGKAKTLAEEHGVPKDQINVDGIGMGAGVVDRFRELGWPVNDIQFGEGPSYDQQDFIEGDMQFVNRRAELHWAVRERIRSGKTSVPKRFRGAWADLMVVRYNFRSDGAIIMERKKDIKKRIKRSPDKGDAVVLAHARDKNALPSAGWK